MPFTPSHAVIALPFLRTPLVPAAIAVGAMAPDLPLFLPVAPFGYLQSHSFAYLPVTIALALGLLLVWRCGLRAAMRELSPQWLARRLPAEWDGGPAAAAAETFARRGRRHPSLAGILLLLLSLALGAASHIVWDLFTHEGRAGIAALDVLWGPLPAYKWLQHGSSVVGLVILAVWAGLWLRRRTPAPPAPRIMPDAVRLAWWISLPVILVSALAIGGALFGPLTSQWRLEHVAYRVLPPVSALWAALTLILCIIIQHRRR
ncbi:MAG TPA: DUF4184 family protein [Microbacterium sp.]|nr:DUF4184 family protein [Microbacterium sp.]